MRIFVDMDGVLCDYYAGVCRLAGFRPWPFCCRPGEWNFFAGEPLNLTNEEVAPHMGHKFYAGLAWLPDGRRILEICEAVAGPKNVFLLSSPWDTPGCEDGKRAWVRANAPAYARRTLLGNCKEACSFPGAVLLDDSEQNCAKFVAVGGDPGAAVLVPRPWNAEHARSDPATGAMLDLRVLADALQHLRDAA